MFQRGRSFLYRTFIATLLLGGATVLPSASRAATSPMLEVTASSKDLEKQIGSFFEKTKGWKVRYEVVGRDLDDVDLRALFDAGDDVPALRIHIDAQPSAHDSDGTVTETRIVITSYFEYGITAAHPRRAAVLEALNAYTTAYWMPQRVSLDRDGDLVLRSSFNIPGRDIQLPAEVIADGVVRTATAWHKLYGELKKAGLPLPKTPL